MSGILNSPYPILICSVEYELSEKFKSEVCSKMYWAKYCQVIQNQTIPSQKFDIKIQLISGKTHDLFGEN